MLLRNPPDPQRRVDAPRVVLGRRDFDIPRPVPERDPEELAADGHRRWARRLPRGAVGHQRLRSRTRRCAGISRLVYIRHAARRSTRATRRRPCRRPRTSSPASSIPCPTMAAPHAVHRHRRDGDPRCGPALLQSDSIRGRDPGALFPLEQLGFIAEHAAARRGVRQPQTVRSSSCSCSTRCTSTGARRRSRPTSATRRSRRPSARWCSQDGAVTYEPLLRRHLDETDLFAGAQ